MDKFIIIWFVAIIAINLILGAWSVGVIGGFLGLAIPTLACLILGLFFGEFTIPVAIVISILQIFHVIQ